MATSTLPQATDFSLDVLGRYVCNGLDEALASTDAAAHPGARPFDVIVVGGGSFGPVVAQHLFAKDPTRARRILVLDAGRYVLPEHVQNLPSLGLSTGVGDPRSVAWGLPWRTDVPMGFPGLAYCLGGRSVYFGGWSPQFLDSELPANRWPASVIAALKGPGPGGSAGYFSQAAEQIGTNTTNDFISGPMHNALRAQLRAGVDAAKIADAIPLAQLPLNLDGVPAGQKDLFKLEAPLAVQASTPRAGFFPFNKFSSVPLLTGVARRAQAESGGDDVRKRLMVVPNCHVTRLVTDGSGPVRRVTAVATSLGDIPVHEEAVVVLALGTIENARVALGSLPGLSGADRIGANLMAHLRSNLTIRIPRASVGGLPAAVKELQASALFLKGRHAHADGQFGHFHLQFTAAGLAQPSGDSEAELFKKAPDLDSIASLRNATDNQIVLTLRGIGEMRPDNPNTKVTLSSEVDEHAIARAFVSINPSADDQTLWNAMDQAADEAALVFAGGQPYEVLVSGTFKAVAAGQPAIGVAPFVGRRDGLGTTHHEAGVLAMGDDPATLNRTGFRGGLLA